jgi:hypothetical protein
MAGAQEGNIGSQAPVPTHGRHRSPGDRGITHMNEAPPLVVDLDGTLTARGTIYECLCRLARERPWELPRLLTRARASCRVGHVFD